MIPVKDSDLRSIVSPVTTVLVLSIIAAYLEDSRLAGGLSLLLRASPVDIMRCLVDGTPGFARLHASIIGSAFLHEGVFHLVVNLVFLWAFAPALEKSVGMVRFLLFYLGAILIAFYTHSAVNPHLDIPVVGASGAIAGIMGAYIVLRPTGRILTLIPLVSSLEVVEIPSIVFILVWLALQILPVALSHHWPSHVAWFTHIGGFLFGVFSGIHFRLSGAPLR
jgi:membrane associated rhomboid family serine protease